MDKSQLLLLLTCALALYGTGQVWLVQISSYALWPFVGRQEFRAYHLAWWRSIWIVVLVPAALVLAGSVLMLWWRPPGAQPWAVWTGFGLQMALLLGTALWWGPLMARIEAPEGGLSPERYRLLMTTHWLRAGIVTAYAILSLWMLARSAG